MKMGELERSLGGGNKAQRIAVIGGGIAGLGAAWLLSRRHAVTLFEAGSYVGGHANTVDITLDGITHGVDTGFLVFNRCTYPNLCGLFAALDVPVADSEMSFAVSIPGLDLEWAGTDLNSLFGQRRNLLRPRFIGMLRDIARFNRETTLLAREHAAPDVSLGTYLAQNGYGDAFRDWYLLPMAAAIWSCPTHRMLAYPLATFLRFCHNHGLLQITDRPQWKTVRGGSREYVRRVLATLPDVRTRSPVLSVMRDEQGVDIVTAAGSERFDQVVFACHSDQALKILGASASTNERAVLDRVGYQDNRAVLHTDVRLLPQRSRVWSAWNYMSNAGADGGDGAEGSAAASVSVSYLINRLQPVPFTRPVVVSLNPLREPDPATVLADISYAHPVFDQAAIDAQAHLPMLQGRQRSWFCGAWTGYGFHEDGLRSAVDVAAALGVVAPWRARALPLHELAT